MRLLSARWSELLQKLKSRHPIDIPDPWRRTVILVGVITAIAGLFLALPLGANLWYGFGGLTPHLGTIIAVAIGLGSLGATMAVLTLVARY